jgi:hypothetical protein
MDEAVFMNTSVLNLSIMGDTCNLRPPSQSSVFLYILGIILTCQERREAVFTVILLRFFSLGQHLLERHECSNMQDPFLTKVFPFENVIYHF